MISGNGGFGPQVVDQSKFNAVLKTLIIYDWPVSFSVVENGSKHDYLFVYYIAYYLVPALLGKIFGWGIANISLFIWASFGYLLAFLWLIRLTKTNLLWSGIIFFFFSGLDVIPAIWKIMVKGEDYFIFFDWWHWSIHSNLYSICTSAPIAIGSWLSVSLMINEIKKHEFPKKSFFVVAISCLWSPFITLALLFILIGFTFFKFKLVLREWKDIFISSNFFIAVFIGILLISYFIARWSPYELPPSLRTFHTGEILHSPSDKFYLEPKSDAGVKHIFIIDDGTVFPTRLYEQLNQEECRITTFQDIGSAVLELVTTKALVDLFVFVYEHEILNFIHLLKREKRLYNRVVA